jgi:hypothetical protein
MLGRRRWSEFNADTSKLLPRRALPQSLPTFYTASVGSGMFVITANRQFEAEPAGGRSVGRRVWRENGSSAAGLFQDGKPTITSRSDRRLVKACEPPLIGSSAAFPATLRVVPIGSFVVKRDMPSTLSFRWECAT